MSRILFVLLAIGCSRPVSEPTSTSGQAVKAMTPRNVIYLPSTRDTPRVRMIALPQLPGGTAIWGSLGRDHANTIYACISYEEGGAARLLAINPANDAVRDLLSIAEQLSSRSIPETSQNKIHTKILQMSDGNLYFASMDETGELEDGSRLPKHGSHVWRLKPNDTTGDYLRHFPEALIASAVGGRFVYFLGYPGHVLHQYDISTSMWASVRVGSVGGHTTRNFFADDHGHIYVPRIGADQVRLVEYDSTLTEVVAHPLDYYSRTPDDSSHGIVGIAKLESGDWVFTTDKGRLYRLDPDSKGSALTDLGWLHPKGKSYAASLFCLDGRTQLVSLANVVPRGEPAYEWVVFDLKTRLTTTTSMVMPVPPGGKNILVYGSLTRDDTGRCYLGGRYVKMVGGKEVSVPALWVVEP